MLKTYTTKSRIFQRQYERRKRRRERRKRLLCTILAIATIFLLVYAGCIGGKKLGEKISEIRYPVAYSSYITEYANDNNLDPYLVIALIKQESNFVADARSEYAGGLMQLTEVTAEEYAKKLGLTDYNYMDPETNIKIGCYVLASMIKKYDNIDTALAAYNAGVGNVDNWLKNPDYSSDGKTLYYIPFSETRHYVKKVNQYIEIYKTQAVIQSDNRKDE